MAAALVVTGLVAVGCTSSDDGEDAAAPTTTTAEPAALLADEADFAEVGATMDAFVAEQGLNGAGLVIVDRDEGAVYEHYVGEEFGPDHLSLVASSSKMITAGVLMHLHDEGLLDVDAPVADTVDWPGAAAANPEVTTAQLLSNSSGLVGLLPDPTYNPYLCQYLAVGTLSECGERIFTSTDDDADVVPPDSEFRYGGGQWQVAGAVAESVSGKSWAELLDEVYAGPCGLDGLGYNNHYAQSAGQEGAFGYPRSFAGDPANLSATDNPNMEGGAFVSPSDYSKLLLMHLRGGVCERGRVLSESSTERMHTDRAVDTYGADLGIGGGGEPAERSESEPDSGSPYEGYGLGWWLGADGHIEDAGAFGAVPWLDLERGYGAYLVVEDSGATGRELAVSLRSIIESEIDAVGKG